MALLVPSSEFRGVLTSFLYLFYDHMWAPVLLWCLFFLSPAGSEPVMKGWRGGWMDGRRHGDAVARFMITLYGSTRVFLEQCDTRNA